MVILFGFLLGAIYIGIYVYLLIHTYTYVYALFLSLIILLQSFLLFSLKGIDLLSGKFLANQRSRYVEGSGLLPSFTSDVVTNRAM